MTRNCESCGAPPPTIKEGPWKGQQHMHDYCAACSKDLCSNCLANGKCRETIDGKHLKEEED